MRQRCGRVKIIHGLGLRVKAVRACPLVSTNGTVTSLPYGALCAAYIRLSVPLQEMAGDWREPTTALVDSDPRWLDRSSHRGERWGRCTAPVPSPAQFLARTLQRPSNLKEPTFYDV